MRVILSVLVSLLMSSSALAHNCGREMLLVYAKGASLAWTNNDIARGRLDIERLYREGYLYDDPAPVHPMRDGAPDVNATTGFRRVWLRSAASGFFIPEEVDLRNPENINGYDGYVIVMPGIGTDRSDATSLFTIGQEFKSGKNLKTEPEGRKLKLLPILADVTLSGMASDAPLYFGSREWAMTLVRHYRLILKAAFPGARCVLSGRSQGGLYAMEYADLYGDVDAVVAISPSPTRKDLHQQALELGVKNLKTVMDVPIQLNRSFLSYQIHTPGFLSFGTFGLIRRFERWASRARREREVPVLIQVGAQDKGYPAEYFEYVQQFSAESPEREVEVYAQGGHDLWSRRDRHLFRAVLRRKAEFLQRVLFQ